MTNQQGAPEALENTTDDGGATAQQLFIPAGWNGKVNPPLYTAAQIAALVEAQQPAPSAAAAVGQEPNFNLLRKALADRRFRGETDLQDLVNMAAHVIAEDGAILRARQTIIEQLKAAPQPSPTPQADSQPAPAAQPAPLGAPIDMVLHCPACGLQHIDAPDERTPDWKNEPHRSHLCHGCGHIWRPADVPTNGVAAVQTKGKADSPIAARAQPAAAQGVTAEPGWKSEDFEVTHYPPMPTRGMLVGMPKGVKVLHKPTGLFAISEDERSQHRNRDVAWNKLQELLATTAVAAPTVPEGMVLVPVGPTPDMVRAGLGLLPNVSGDRWDAGAVLARSIYNAMLAAAPHPAPADAEDAALGMAAEYQRWIDFFHKGNGDYNDFLRIELNPDAARKQGGAT